MAKVQCAGTGICNRHAILCELVAPMQYAQCDGAWPSRCLLPPLGLPASLAACEEFLFYEKGSALHAFFHPLGVTNQLSDFLFYGFLGIQCAHLGT